MQNDASIQVLQRGCTALAKRANTKICRVRNRMAVFGTLRVAQESCHVRFSVKLTAFVGLVSLSKGI